MSQRESGTEKDNQKWPSASLFNNITFTSCNPLVSQILVARLEWILSEFLLYFSAGFISKITFSEWQLNQFNNVQFYTVGTYSPIPLHPCNCRLLSGITRVCFNAELFSSPDPWGGMTPWEGHDCDSGLRCFPLPPLSSHASLICHSQSRQLMFNFPSVQLC